MFHIDVVSAASSFWKKNKAKKLFALAKNKIYHIE